MAKQTIKVASFPYTGDDGVERTALRGDTVDITDDADLKRGQRLDVFASDADKKPGTAFGDFLAARQADPAATDEPVGTPSAPPADRPGSNDSRDKWVAYATGKGAPAEETKPTTEGGLSRDALRDKYGA